MTCTLLAVARASVTDSAGVQGAGWGATRTCPTCSSQSADQSSVRT